MAERERGEDIRITPETGEVGGVAPAAVMPAVGADRVRWGQSGQVCSSPSPLR